ncbi:hypothetical protein [Pseudopedobacter beijingensis]|uniref:YD repeat-containing protein n=1 Tax=Pseudopedobacter beijingensis TaxID=1207056 RepID=A0ABW4IFG4_9SPHI
MKKIYLLLFMLAIGIASCKKKSDHPEPITDPEEPGIEVPPAPEANTLPVKMSINADGKSEVYTITYQSGTKKIAKIEKANGEQETYQYSGDLIERINYGSSGDDYTKFEYNEKGALIREIRYRSSVAAAKTEYSYPAENKVIFIESEYKNNNWEAGDAAILEFDSKGNVVSGSSKEVQVAVSYDNKNTPFLNVTGWSKIHYKGGIPLGDNVDVEDVVGRRSNPIKTKVTGAMALDLDFSYEFGDNNNAKFPTKITGKEGAETAFVVEICYSTDCGITDNSNNPGGGEQPNPETSTLPETIVMTVDGKTKNYTITYQGNSAKIDKIQESGGAIRVYEYNQDLIKKEYSESRPEDYELYGYNGDNQLTKVSSYRQGVNNPGEIIFTYSGTKTIATGDELDGRLEFNYDSKGNLTNLDMFEEGKSASAAQISITYDDKNAPFMNVLGWKKIRYLVGVPLGDNIDFEDIIAVANNPSKVTGNLTGENVEVTYSYEFKDSKNPKFPTKITGTVKVGTATRTFTAEITYKQ